MDFTAIDFETANEQPDSACQLGAVVVRGGDIIRRHCWWIRPRPMRFSRHNVAVHGITADQVRDEADFGQLWPSISEVLAGQLLVAHNARFDIGVLRACLLQHRVPIPEIRFTCTRAVSQQAWPDQRGHGLRVVADRLGIRFRHHDALEDALCCAKVLLAAAEEHTASAVEVLEKKLRLSRGRAGEWGCGGPYRSDGHYGRRYYARQTFDDPSMHSATMADQPRIYQRRLRLRGTAGTNEAPISNDQLERWMQRAAECTPLSGQAVVITGLLTRLDRHDAERLVAAAGGENCRSVTRQTSMLVVGSPDARTLRAGRSSSTKQERAEQRISEGQAIEVLNEEGFLSRFGELDARLSDAGHDTPVSGVGG